MACAEKARYKLLEVRLKKHNTIGVDLVPSSCKHKLTVQSIFDRSSCVFPVAPKVCISWPASKVQTPTGFYLQGWKKLYQIVHLFQMFVTYVKHLSHGETQREMIVATVLYIFKARASANPKAVPMGYLVNTYQKIPDYVKKHKLHLIKPPTAALDYRTYEGRCMKRKKHMDIEMPKEVQMTKKHMESLEICQSKHGTGKPPRFHKECDAVAERLTQEKEETMLNTDLKKILSAM